MDNRGRVATTQLSAWLAALIAIFATTIAAARSALADDISGGATMEAADAEAVVVAGASSGHKIKGKKSHHKRVVVRGLWTDPTTGEVFTRPGKGRVNLEGMVLDQGEERKAARRVEKRVEKKDVEVIKS